MRIRFAVLAVLISVCIVPLKSRAQTYWVLNYEGVATATNGAGKLVSQPMTDRTLVQDCARNAGLASTDGLALVLHINGSAVGDTLEVVNTTDPNSFRCNVSTLAFPQSYTNSAGTLVKTFVYIYNNDSQIFSDPSSHSRGSVIITKTLSSGGGATHTAITGKVQFWLGEWSENTPAPKATICSGKFTATRALNVP